MIVGQCITDCSDLVPWDETEIKQPFCLMAVDLVSFDVMAAQAVLTPLEQEQYGGYRFPKRQNEWLGGRLACKTAVAQLLGLTGLTLVEVANDDHGRPFVAGHGVDGVEVSISHSGDVAMALASFSPCGLDIQEITPVLAKVEEKFVHPEERAILPVFAISELEQFGLVWAVKESLRKQLCLWPLLGFLEARIEAISKVDGGFMVQCTACRDTRVVTVPLVHVALYGSYGLALCFEPDLKE